ncbi:hypothetical protein [Desulfurispira natronophila]|uniref:hypothetical protein n=1 Tax=Desulfurispira natronophila TaxID=682562 RepID=UPI001C85D1A6|nr:hypothetical protein [Desulfurispira natronophila]
MTGTSMVLQRIVGAYVAWVSAGFAGCGGVVQTKPPVVFLPARDLPDFMVSK